MIPLIECETQNIRDSIGELDVDILEVDAIEELPFEEGNTTYKQVRISLRSRKIMTFELPSNLPDFYTAIKYKDSDEYVFVEDDGQMPRKFGIDDSSIEALTNKEVDEVVFVIKESANVDDFKGKLSSTELVITICGK